MQQLTLNFECLIYHTKLIVLIFAFGLQAFLTLARDIKSKMDTKLVWKTDIYCNYDLR